MIKNGLFGCSRFLLTLVFVSLVSLLSGCCSFCDTDKCCPEVNCEEDCPISAGKAEHPDCEFCAMDVVYAFNVPGDDTECPQGMVVLTAEPTNVEQDGGAGVVERDGGPGVIERDGGPGIVERESRREVTNYCAKPCAYGEVYAEPNKPHVIDWTLSSANKVLIARQKVCMPAKAE